MSKNFALAFFAITIILVVFSAIIANRTIDTPTLVRAIQVMIPACIVTSTIGYLLGKVLEKSKSDTKIFNNISQQKYIDDLLIKPDEIIGKSSFIETSGISSEDYPGVTTEASFHEEPVEKKIIE